MPTSSKQNVADLHEENAMLREEVRVSRRASEITAQLVVQQFVTIEEILHRLEDRAKAEATLGLKLGEKLRESEVRERELAGDRQRLEDMQIAAMNMMEDIAAAQKAAEAATQAKSDFLANMSHEIRTPMTAILGFAENLLTSELSESDRQDAIATIRRNGEHLLGIINDILDLSKIEAGKMTVERIRCSPCQMAAEVASLIRVRAESKGLSFGLEYIGSIPEAIQTDPVRLRQVLINVIGNAIKFTASGGVRIIIRCLDAQPEPQMQFDIVDTGVGMTREQVGRLFQPFSQADASTTRQFGGTGLGLTISRRLVHMLGGDIEIVETALGQGTQVRVTVATGSLEGVAMLEDPVGSTVIAPAEPAAPARAETGERLRCRILLAEDGPDNQRLISFMLSKAGAHVSVVENGQEAVDSALAAWKGGAPFDVILMDMQMPVLDGYGAVRCLRDQGYAGRIIALTAHAMAGDRDRCLAAGCDDYASKPVNRRQLIQVIQHHLQRSPALA